METTQDVLLANEPVLVQASSGKRFANYLIDFVIFYVCLFALGMLIGLINPQFLDNIDDANPLLDRLVTLIMYGVYMFLVEGIFKGKSIGKMITGTRAVNQDGTPISFGTALGRGFSRAVPFNAFSALGDPSYPWHDRWTNTYVIDEKQSVLPTETGY